MVIAVFLVSAGCQGVAKQSLERLIHQPVCPVCKAVSIEDCHCFHAIDSAGYCETSWVSLDPGSDVGPDARGSLPDEDGILTEELPTPQAVITDQP